MKISLLIILGGLFVWCIVMAMRESLPSTGNGIPSSPCPPQGYTWQEWEKKVKQERPFYLLAALLLVAIMVYIQFQ